MKAKLKVCNRCNKDRIIWKNYKGKKYCSSCWNVVKPGNPSIQQVKNPKPKKRISARTEKRIIQDKQYSKLRKDFLNDNPCCVARLSGCTHCEPESLTIQHKKGRVGKLYLDTRYWITLCLNCHRWANEHPKEAEQLGLAQSRLKKEENGF